MYILSRVRNYLFIHLIIIGIIGLCSSCANSRQFTYLQGQFDTAKLSQVNAVEPIIRKGDLLSIIVFSDNPDATKIFNQSLITTSSSGYASSAGNTSVTQGLGTSSPSSPGYQVDDKGNIVFQGLGKLNVEGLTKAQLKDLLDSKLKDTLLKNPYYNIRFLNYKFTLMGEVAKPGIINIPGEKINLLEALALAGDMTYYGRRDNILVIRESNGKREFARLDITKPDIMVSPYFYLQQNDLIIVEANRKKAVASDQLTMRNVSIAATLVSVIGILYSIFRN